MHNTDQTTLIFNGKNISKVWEIPPPTRGAEQNHGRGDRLWPDSYGKDDSYLDLCRNPRFLINEELTLNTGQSIRRCFLVPVETEACAKFLSCGIRVLRLISTTLSFNNALKIQGLSNHT